MARIPQMISRRNIWLIVVLVPCLIVAGGGGWVVTSSSGLKWLVGVAEHQSGGNLSAEGVNGSLFDSFEVRQLVLRGEGWRITVNDAQIQWQPAALLYGELKLLSLRAGIVEVLSVPSDKPPVLPERLGLPLTLSVLQIKVGSLAVISKEGATPDFVVNDIEARIHSDASYLQLPILHAHLPFGEFAGSGEIASGKPYVLKANASLDTAVQISGRSRHLHFSAEVGGDLQHIAVKIDGNGAGGSVNGRAQLEPFSAMPISRLQMSFSGLDAARLFDGAPPALVSGNADLHGTAGGELEGALQLRNAKGAALDRNGIPVRGVNALVRWSPALLQLQQLDAELLNGGHITGTVSWRQHGGKLGAQLKVHDVDPAALDTRLRSTHLQGDIALDGVGAEQHAIVALSDGTLDLHGELDRHDDKVTLSSLRMTRGETVLTGDGQMVLDRRRTFRFASKLRRLNLSDFAATPATDLNAELEISGALLPQLEGTLDFTMTHSHFAQYDIGGNGQLEFTGTGHARALFAFNMGDNRLHLEGTRDPQAIRAHLSVDAPDVGQLGGQFGGQLTGHADLSGSLADPRLQFSVQGRDLKLPGGKSITALDADGDLSSAKLQMNLGVSSYLSGGTLNIPKASLELQGDRAHHTMSASARLAQGEKALGEITMKASGGLSDPAQGWKAMQWRGSIDELTGQGVVPFHLLKTVPLTLAKNSIEVGSAEAIVAGGQFEFSGTQWTPKRWHSAGHFSGVKVRAVSIQDDQPIPVQSGYIQAFDSMRVGGTWDATADEHLHGRFEAHRESGDWMVDNSGQRMGLRDIRLSVDAVQDSLHAQLAASGEHLGEIMAQASMPLTHTETGWTILPDAPLAGHLYLDSGDLTWLGPMLNSNLQTGGRLKLDAVLAGTRGYPRLQGNATGDALSLVFLNQGIRLEQGELRARFDSDSVHVDHLEFSVPYLPSPRDKLLENYSLAAGSGHLSASGRIDLVDDKSDLQITAERLPLAQRTDRWIIASGTGHARYANKILLLDGDIRADAGLIDQPLSNRPSLSDDVQIIGTEPAGRTMLPIRANATLDLGDHFYIRASGFEGRLAGRLNMHGEPGELMHVNGSIAAQDAVFNAYGQSLQVDRGIVNFQGPLDDPGLNILALRKGLAVEAGVEVTGTVRHPLVRLVSTPDVPDAEKLSWIVLGRVPDTSGVDSSLLVAAAGSIMGGQSSRQLGKTLGVDEISLGQQTGADSQQVQTMTVGKQLSARARISYEQSLNEPGSIVTFTYKLTPRISVVTRTGTEDALDILYTFRFY